jgi:aminoglycoside phosphotransferase (APT) family kinase protein
MPPMPATLGFVHGDFRTGNYLSDENGITAILDWEIAHLGDPLEDLGWLCVKSWRFGAVDKPAGGFGTREELWDAYETAGGAKINREHARWWEILGTARWGVICMTQAWKHLSGAEESMELASIGRRAVETEVDLLELLG